MSGSHLSKDFFELVKSIGESKSKQEEDRIIVHEVSALKRSMNEKTKLPAPNKKRLKEFLIRLMYVEMLGHDASFGYIKAVELTASTNLLQKRVGYLCCSLVLSPEHEFRFMIINQLQRDLQSSNHLEVCSALMAVCKLVTKEMIPAVQPMIIDLLRHENELVRKKAVMAIHRFHQLHPESILDVEDKLRRSLCDRDPSVMGASLCILHDLIVLNPQNYKDLVPSFVSILKQIKEHRLPREYDYHRIPAPWIQIRLLRILALLGQADQQASEGMYEVLHEVMRRADTGINVGYAIIYECVRTVTMIYPNSTLLDSAAASISRFISSDNHNLKYLGVTGLAAIVKDHPRYASEHQLAVIDCLEDPDETLKRKTLDLLYRMTNPVNVEFISEKLTQYLREATDVYLRTELASRITQCAERYAPSNAWYIQTMTDVFELGGELVQVDVAQNLLRLIAEGSGEDEEQDMELRRNAVETYLELIDQPVLPDILIRVMSWVLGEYGYLSTTMEISEIAERLCELLTRPFDEEDITRAYILTGIIKITAQLGHELEVVHDVMVKYSNSRSTDIQQRCFEYLALVRDFGLMSDVLPIDASCEDIDVDPNLEFLNDFVDHAVANGALRYNPPDDSSDEEDEEGSHRRRKNDRNSLNFEAYEKPELPYAGTTVPLRPNDGYPAPNANTAGKWGPSAQPAPPAGPSSNSTWQDPSNAPTEGAGMGMMMNKRNVKSVWGPKGFNAASEPKQEDHGAVPNNRAAYPNQATQGPAGATAYQTPPQQPYNGAQPAPSQYQQEEEEDEEEQEPDERQMMASALFGGIPGAAKHGAPAAGIGAGKRRTSRTAASTKRRTSRTGPAAAPAARANPRKYSKSREDPTSAAAQGSTEQPSGPIAVDLLDLSFDAPAAPTSGYSNDTSQVVDPFGQSNIHTPAPAPTATPAPAPTAVHEDPFDMLSMGESLSGGDMGFSNPTSTPEFTPLNITTAEFGGEWGNCRCEKKVQVKPTSVRTLDEYMRRVSGLNLQPVEAIAKTNEAIAAGMYMNSMRCLIHTKIRSAGYLDVTVRTPDSSTTEKLCGMLYQNLQ